MLSYIDPIIFPDRCDVLEIVPSQRYVFPIFKNASSSLYMSGYRVLSPNELTTVDTIEVYVRDPLERFISGAQTYLRNLDPKLDKETALYFVEQYLFLDRHYCPQFHWLLNLQRFSSAQLTIKPLDSIAEITTIYDNAKDKDQELAARFSANPKINYYLQIDKILTEDLIGQTVSFTEIVTALKNKYPEVYRDIIQRNVDLIQYAVS